MSRNLPELIFFISRKPPWNYFEPGRFNSFGIALP